MMILQITVLFCSVTLFILPLFWESTPAFRNFPMLDFAEAHAQHVTGPSSSILSLPLEVWKTISLRLAGRTKFRLPSSSSSSSPPSLINANDLYNEVIVCLIRRAQLGCEPSKHWAPRLSWQALSQHLVVAPASNNRPKWISRGSGTIRSGNWLLSESSGV